MVINYKVTDLNSVGNLALRKPLYLKQSSQEAASQFTCFKGREYITLHMKNDDVSIVHIKPRFKGLSETKNGTQTA
jgi:hypothetical protein